MTDAFIDTYSGLEARMKIVDAITNNLANANTAGFKRDFGFILQNETGLDAATRVDLAPGDVVPTAKHRTACAIRAREILASMQRASW